MEKIGIIRCKQEALACCGSRCFDGIRKKNGAFKKYKDVELVGYDTCGGCPGKNVKKIAYNMVQFAGAEVIHIANCMITTSNKKFSGMDRKKVMEEILKKNKGRLNDKEFQLLRAKLISDKLIPYYCKYKNKIIKDIESLGVKVVEHTHGPK